MPAVQGTVTVTVTDKNGTYKVDPEPVVDVAAYLEHVEEVVVRGSSYCGPLQIAFLVDLGDEIDGFTRYYDNRVHLTTV